MDKKCSKCKRSRSALSTRKDDLKVRINTVPKQDSKVLDCRSTSSKQLRTTDYEKFESCSKKPTIKPSAEKLGCSCKKSKSQIKLGATSSQRIDFKKSKNDVHVDVSPIFAESTSSGGISIPVKLMVSVKRSQKQVADCKLFRNMLLVKPPPQLVYNSCTFYAYCDPYLDEMADIFDVIYSSHAIDAGAGGNEFMDTSGPNCYVEPYTVFGYTRESQESVGIQTDLVLGAQLESQSLESLNNGSKTEITQIAKTSPCGKAVEVQSCKNPEMPWTGIILVTDIIGDTIIRMDKPIPDDNVDQTIIIPYQKPPPKKKKSGCSPCSRCCDVIIPDPPEPPIIPEIEFVYNRNCWKTEPYIHPLRYYSPVLVIVQKGMSWETIVVPAKINLRELGKVQCTCHPKPQLRAPELKCKVCKMPLHKSAPTLPMNAGAKNTIQMLPTRDIQAPMKAAQSLPKPCVTCTKSAGSIMSPSKPNSVTFMSGTMKKDAARCKEGSKSQIQGPAQMEVLYKSNNVPTSNTGVDNNYCTPCQKTVPAGYEPCKAEDPNAYCERPDPVAAALLAFETELKPMKCTLNMVQEKLKNLNMPELDFLLNKQDSMQNKKVTKIKLKADSIKLLYAPSKKKSSQKFGKVKCRRKKSRSRSKLSRSKSRSKSCSRCPSNASCKSRKSSSKKIPCPKKKKSKDKTHKKSSHKKSKSSRTPSQKSSCSSRSTASQVTKSCYCSSKVTNGIVARPSDKSTASSCTCKIISPSSSSKKPKKNTTRVRSLRIRSKHFTKNYSRSSSQDSNLSECPFLDAIKSILVDRQQITQQNCGRNATQMSRNVENIRLHLRLQPKKKSHCRK